MKPQNKITQGFTLIELLIVMTIIGVLAIAVISAINPIEQVNKARDAGRNSDSTQIIGALERYYVNNGMYPWNKYTGANCPGVNTQVAFKGTADMNGVGICNSGVGFAVASACTVQAVNTTGCSFVAGPPSVYGPLIEADEIKEVFTRRRYFKSGRTLNDVIVLIKPANDPSISVCYSPASQSTRDKWNIAGGLKWIDDGSGNTGVTVNASGIATGIVATAVIRDCYAEYCPGGVCGAAPNWASMATSCYVCIPEE